MTIWLSLPLGFNKPFKAAARWGCRSLLSLLLFCCCCCCWSCCSINLPTTMVDLPLLFSNRCLPETAVFLFPSTICLHSLCPRLGVPFRNALHPRHFGMEQNRFQILPISLKTTDMGKNKSRSGLKYGDAFAIKHRSIFAFDVTVPPSSPL